MKQFKTLLAGTILGVGINPAQALVTYTSPEAIQMTMEEIEKECKHYGINSPFILEYTNKTICAILEKPAEKNVSSLDLERVVIPLTTLIGGGGILYLISSEIRRRKKRTEDTGNPLDLGMAPQVRSRVEPGKKREILSEYMVPPENELKSIPGSSDATLAELISANEVVFRDTEPSSENDGEENIDGEKLLNELIGNYFCGEEISEEGKMMLITGLVNRTMELSPLDEGKLRDVFLLAELEPKTIPKWISRIEEGLRVSGQTLEDGLVGTILNKIHEDMSEKKREEIFQELAGVCKIESYLLEQTEPKKIREMEEDVFRILDKYDITLYRNTGHYTDERTISQISLDGGLQLSITLRSDENIIATIEDPIMKTKDERQVDIGELEKIIARKV